MVNSSVTKMSLKRSHHACLRVPGIDGKKDGRSYCDVTCCFVNSCLKARDERSRSHHHCCKKTDDHR